MSRNVLVPVDGSAAAEAALEHAREQFPDATVTLLYVVNPMADYSRQRAYPGYTDDDEYSSEREKGEAVLESAADRLPASVDVETELVAGDPTRAIVDYSEEHDVDHVVIGSHGREGVARYLLGSVAEAVVRRSVPPVTVVRPRDRYRN
ncbi:universal stress protein [Natrarchaeobius sp. A-rgal3]|uniref:universal stress protein n=1 Tax=Natrarchaeobius versutus TaxID=1679078 RepID=UPI003510AA59